MNGQGLVALDVALFMGVVAAAAVHLYSMPNCWRGPRGLVVGSALRTTGWVCLSARFGSVLLTTGDIYIPLPSLLALLFIAAGDILSVLVRRKENRA